MKTKKPGFEPGRAHPSAKLTARIVTAARRRARARSSPKGWITELAHEHGVTVAALVSAIGGQTWAHLSEPPAPPRERTRPGKGTRRYCPSCKRPKYAKGCKARFHQIDHRRETSAANLQQARRARRSA